ncbi:hypothetical protein [Nocardia bhagyanarayanae]|uniref:Mce-associated membrane protein n=1 Tax=Nocardia bhagyanarayanae TaxID=1215925 RepID=A0A543FF71_9NOCA|nr:hypothetical protein [Nocardia bhagyanarayanae]TQM32513.1 Mce-associated membrane protein [Nocardia bhagyanarayanae]
MSRTLVLGALVTAAAAAAVVSAPTAAAWPAEDARLAACDFAREVGAYDHTALDGYFQRVLERSTGTFAAEFAGAAPELRQAMQQAQVRAWVEWAECGSVGGDLLRQKVLITMSQVRANANSPEPQPQHITMTATIDNVLGRWLVSELDSPQL